MVTKGLLAVVGVMGLALWVFYTANLQLKNDLQVAVIKQEAAETSLLTAQSQTELAQKQLARFMEKMEEIEQARAQAERQVNRMRDTFQDHDFAKLLTKKPGLIENLMVKKTQEVFDEIESLTAQ